MRLFIAINLNDEIKDELLKQTEYLKTSSHRGNFSRRENLHITLAFIGEYGNVDAVKKAMDEIESSSFDLSLYGGGNFGSLYWAGIKKEPLLDDLAGKIRSSLKKNGIPFDRKPFSPHITIAREVIADSAIRISPKQAKMKVDRFSLMRSDRINGKLTYTQIYAKAITD